MSPFTNVIKVTSQKPHQLQNVTKVSKCQVGGHSIEPAQGRRQNENGF
jgi:hypothetical protein